MSNKPKEEEIISYIKEVGESVTNKNLCDKFEVSESYIKSLRWRLKYQLYENKN